MDPLDKILATDDRLVPSSGFEARVMDAVRANEAAPPPLPFPWGRFGVVVVALAAWAAAGAFVVEQVDWSAFSAIANVALNPIVGYGALAIAGSLVVAAFPRFRSIE